MRLTFYYPEWVSERAVVIAQSGTHLVVAERNLEGFRGLTFDAFGALFEEGPMSPPAALVRALEAAGVSMEPGSLAAKWKDTVRGHQRTDPFITFREVLLRSVNDVFSRLGLSLGPDPTVDQALDELRLVRIHPEVHRVLQELEGEVPLAVISNMDTSVLLGALHNHGLAFSFVITSDEEQRYKPDSSMFRRAIRYIGLPATNILHVGDSYEEDVLGAASVGMGALLIHRRGTPPDSPGEALGVVQGLDEVRDFLRRSSRGG